MSNREMIKIRRAAIGERLRAIRKIRGRSQFDVSSKAGITQASLSNYETGKRELPLSTAINLAAELDIPFGDMLQTTDMIVLRDSRLSRAMRILADSPQLLQSIVEDRTAKL
jgi:transcriptional regulator with XRE-family HTH domain